MKLLPILLITVILMGCGPSGTWSDDPKNWKRAFGEARPVEGVTVVHSWYMRTPHFTAEFAWFFELTLSDKVKRNLIESPGLRRLPLFSTEDLKLRVFSDRPGWFKPEPLSDYDVFESTTDPGFFMLVQKSGGRSFWTRSQL